MCWTEVCEWLLQHFTPQLLKHLWLYINYMLLYDMQTVVSNYKNDAAQMVIF